MSNRLDNCPWTPRMTQAHRHTTISIPSLQFPMAYLPSHPLDLNETNADTSHIHTLCLVRRRLAWDVVYLEPEVLYWPKIIWRHSSSWAFWDVSPGFPDDKSLPGHSPMFPAHLYCVQQSTRTDLDTSFTPGLRLQVSSVVGVLFPRRRSSLGSVRSLKPHKKKSNQITLNSFSRIT